MEIDNPTAWLVSLERDPNSYSRLVDESGSLALAAYRLARARCANEPTPREVASVAKEIAARTGYFDVIPTRSALADEYRGH